MEKLCVVEMPHGIKLAGGKVVNPGVPVMLVGRDIYNLMTKNKAKVFAIVNNDVRVSLNIYNYNMNFGLDNTDSVDNSIVMDSITDDLKDQNITDVSDSDKSKDILEDAQENTNTEITVSKIGEEEEVNPVIVEEEEVTPVIVEEEEVTPVIVEEEEVTPVIVEEIKAVTPRITKPQQQYKSKAKNK